MQFGSVGRKPERGVTQVTRRRCGQELLRRIGGVLLPVEFRLGAPKIQEREATEHRIAGCLHEDRQGAMGCSSAERLHGLGERLFRSGNLGRGCEPQLGRRYRRYPRVL